MRGCLVVEFLHPRSSAGSPSSSSKVDAGSAGVAQISLDQARCASDRQRDSPCCLWLHVMRTTAFIDARQGGYTVHISRCAYTLVSTCLPTYRATKKSNRDYTLVRTCISTWLRTCRATKISITGRTYRGTTTAT